MLLAFQICIKRQSDGKRIYSCLYLLNIQFEIYFDCKTFADLRTKRSPVTPMIQWPLQRSTKNRGHVTEYARFFKGSFVLEGQNVTAFFFYNYLFPDLVILGFSFFLNMYEKIKNLQIFGQVYICAIIGFLLIFLKD